MAARLQGFPNAWKLSRHNTAGLIRAARQADACQLVIGSRHRSRWSRLLNGSTVADQVLRAAGDLPVHVVNVGRPDKTATSGTAQDLTPGNAAQPEAPGTDGDC